MDKNLDKGLFLVWKNYQRRPEILAPLLNCRLEFIPHLFSTKYLRPLDYLIKIIVSVYLILKCKPDFIIGQCPPTYSVIPAILTGKPYMIDAHNPLFQVEIWKKLPLTQYLVNKSIAIIAHNSEIFQLAKKIYPSNYIVNIPNPIEVISSSYRTQRQDRQVLVISSFDFWDEPVELIIECLEELTDFTFVVTANINKLPSEMKNRLQKINNVQLTGFLPTEEYQKVLCSSAVALVLTTSEATQPEGACEALSSNTPLILSKTSLTKKMFGQWAVLVDNTKESVVAAFKSLSAQELNLAFYRDQWNTEVKKEISAINSFLSNNN